VARSNPTTYYLLSLAAQLIEYFPDYAEALVNTIKPLHLSVRVDITIETIKDSRVQGVVINNLYSRNPQEALHIILRQPLATLPNPPTQPTLILIDALDEAVTFSDRENLVTLLDGVRDLPTWVRFVLTCRPDEQRVLSYFQTPDVFLYNLPKKSQDSKKDIHQYATDKVQSQNVQLQLQKFSVIAETLVEQIADLADGNFLYTKILLNDIETGVQSLEPDSLAQLPMSLDEIYQRFLLRLHSSEWQSRYQPILGILAVAKSPISEQQLANILSDIGESDLRHSLQIVCQFLNVVRLEFAQPTYTLFHQSLRDYLLDRDRNQTFWCSPKDGHQRIVNHYWQYHPRHWSTCDRYGLLYLPQHLVSLAQLESAPRRASTRTKLYELLAGETSDRQNAWFVAKNEIGQTESYLADIKLAWQQAEEECLLKPVPHAIALQCRYALMIASVNSLAGKYPPSLLVALLLGGQRTLPEVLTYIRQNTDPDKRAEAYLSLLKLPSLLGDRQPAIVQEGLRAASKCYWAWTRAKFQLAFARYLTEIEQQQLQRAVFAGMQKLQPAWEKPHTLEEIAPDLPDFLLSEALETICGIEDDFQQEKALVALLPRLTGELLDSAIQYYDMTSLRCRPAILAAQIPMRSPIEQDSLIERAFNETKTITVEYWQAMALKSLVPYLTEPMLFEAIAIASSNHSQNQQFEDGWVELVKRLIKLGKFTDALRVVPSIQTPYRRVEALVVLYPHLFPAERQEVLDIVKAIKDPYWYAEVMGALAIALPDSNNSLIQQALADMLIADTDEQEQTLGKLAIQLSDTDTELRQIFKSLLAIQNSGKRANVLIELAPHLPKDLIEEALQVAWGLNSDKDESRTIIAFNQPSPMTLRRLSVSQGQDFSVPEQKLVSTMSANLPEEVLAIAKGISDEDSKVKLLAKLAYYLPENLLGEALEIARSIIDKSNRAFLLAVVALKLIAIDQEPPRSEIRETIQYIKRRGTDRARHAIATYLFKEKEFKSALEILSSVQDKSIQAITLVSFAPKLPQQLLPQILPLIQSFHWADTIRILVAFPPEIAIEPLQAIIDSIQNCPTDKYARLAKEGYAPLLKHLSDVQQSKLNNLVNEHIGLEEKFGNRLQILNMIAPLLPDDTIQDLLYPAWKDTIKAGAELDRTTMLAAVGMLAPFILKIGGIDSVREIFHAVRDVERWWQ
jgi:hypothetical protein